MSEFFDFEGLRNRRTEKQFRDQYFSEPDYEQRLVNIGILEANRFKMSPEDFRAIANLDNKNSVPARLVVILVELQIPCKV